MALTSAERRPTPAGARGAPAQGAGRVRARHPRADGPLEADGVADRDEDRPQPRARSTAHRGPRGRRGGLRLPLVYNTGGYDSPEALALLDGIVDIYMPDMKYGDETLARRYSKVPDYVRVSRAAVREMHRQVGDLVLDEDGVARRGLLVRHLVLPGGLADTEAVLGFLAEHVSRRTYLNLMDQYHPCHRVEEFPELNRRLTVAEYEAALTAAARQGLTRLDPECRRRTAAVR